MATSGIYDAIFSDEKTVNIKVNGHKLRVTYNRGFFSLENIRQLGREESDLKNTYEEGTQEYSDALADAMLDRLEKIILDWDIVNPITNAKVVPDRDAFSKMSVNIINQIWEQISDDGNPKSATR